MKTPLVLLPGMMCDGRLFEPQIQALADIAEIWVGHIGAAASVEMIAAGVLEEVPFPRFALCGLSMGGIVAMQILAQAPDRVTHLALLDTNHLSEIPERQRLRGPQIERVRQGRLREVLIEEMKPNYLAGAHQADSALLERVLDMGLQLGPDVFERQSLALRDRPDATTALRRFGGPALVLCGEEDKLCPPERHRAIADLMPGSTLVVVPGAGHLTTLEAPTNVNYALRVWLLSEARGAQAGSSASSGSAEPAAPNPVPLGIRKTDGQVRFLGAVMQQSTSDTHHSLKARLAAREPLIGTFLKTPAAVVAEILAMTELDLLCLDAEHAPFDRRDLDSCIFAVRAQGKPVLVRVPASSAEHVLNALDMGADGIVAPHIRNAAEARELARMAHFGPGGRGYAGSPRAALYTRCTMAEHLARASGSVVVVAMIEDVEAVQNIDEIVAVEGLDAVFVGRADLTVAYGKADPYDAAVVAAVERVCAAARSVGMPLGMFVPKLEDVRVWTAQGASYFLLESDQSFLLRGADSLVQRFRATLVP